MAFSRFFCAYFSVTLLIGQSLLVRAEPIEQVPLFDPAKDTDAASVLPAPLPFYAVAHRVLTVQGVKDAVAHGANALELDMTTWKDHGGWWGQHDDEYETRGDTAETLFKTIVEQRRAGKNITFVWLDIKNPNNCTLDIPELRYCSIAGLQDMARELLQPFGVRVIYEFNRKNMGPTPAYRFIARSLNDYEAATSYGKVDWVLDEFNRYGPANARQRVMSYGGEPLSSGFGDCTPGDKGTCAEMRHAVESGEFGKVIAWTSTEGEGKYVDKLLGVANIDALLYGSNSRDYDNGGDIRAAFNDIFKWVSDNPHRRFLAGQDDSPW
ncbi:hypothetical protein DXG01_012035 [Tephrocybe rancida]|nr:hypothetical protein DXG01_012035 [Tephrocybe rancida]